MVAGCRDISANLPNTEHSLGELYGTLPLQLQKRHPYDYEDYRDFQDKKDHHCMVAGVELETHAAGHEMSKINNHHQKSRASQT